MAASTVPVTRDWLGVKWGNHTKIFTNTVQEEACHPEMITHVDPFTRSNLEFPLKHKNTIDHESCFQWAVEPINVCSKPKHGWHYKHHYLSRHHFCICATNLDSSIKTSSIVGLHYIPTIGFVCSNTTVVWTCTNTPSKPTVTDCFFFSPFKQGTFAQTHLDAW